jgi:hypothetical protein
MAAMRQVAGVMIAAMFASIVIRAKAAPAVNIALKDAEPQTKRTFAARMRGKHRGWRHRWQGGAGAFLLAANTSTPPGHLDAILARSRFRGGISRLAALLDDDDDLVGCGLPPSSGQRIQHGRRYIRIPGKPTHARLLPLS